MRRNGPLSYRLSINYAGNPTMDQRVWQDEAEKAGGKALAALLTNLSESQRDLNVKLDTQATSLHELSVKIDHLISGFPGGDVDGHRRYHESVIEWRELRNRMLRACLQKMGEAGSLAALGWLLYALWTMFKLEIKKT